MRWVLGIGLLGVLAGALWLWMGSSAAQGDRDLGAGLEKGLDLVNPARATQPEEPLEPSSLAAPDPETGTRALASPESQPEVAPRAATDGNGSRASQVLIAPGDCVLEVRVSGYSIEAADQPVVLMLGLGGRSLQATVQPLSKVWKLTGLYPGQYALRAQSVDAPFLGTETYDFRLSQDNSPRRLELVLEASPCLKGRVVDNLGLPIAKAELVAPALLGLADGPGRWISDANGEFAVCYGTGSPLEVHISAEGYLTQTYLHTVNPGEVVWTDIMLIRERRVTGTVHWPDGSPAAEARVYGRTSQSMQSTKSDANGYFELHGLEPVPLLLYARGGGESDDEACGRWQYGADEDLAGLELNLDPSLAYRGLLLSTEGQPVPAMGVTLTAVDNAQVTRRALTDASGRFEFTGLYPGEYTVGVDSRSRAIGRIQLRTGEAALEETLRVYERTGPPPVLDGDGKPQW
ncbi:MAG TPA: carboxypeptidase-like regulatory domain-containing protein [Planctomycetota bacterium]|nr:carboxypeptidase-like regulatory domain-containing protein [Planctomycetota bacterium]